MSDQHSPPLSAIPTGPRNRRFHASHLYTEAMPRDASADLEIIDLCEYEAELSEGTAHSGRSALIGRRP